MIINIHNTTKIVTLDGGAGMVPARVWEGFTATGIPVHCFITRIAVREGMDPKYYEEFEAELQAMRPPSPEIEAIPLRLIL